MTTLEGNKLIAKFMGYKFVYYSNEFNMLEINGKMKSLESWAKYHRNWNWLMSVVEKIEQIKYVNVLMVKTSLGEFSIEISHYTPSYHITQNNKMIFVKEKTLTKIGSVWLAIIKFIEWYNKQNELSSN
jgi:hypothetical protein